ncbi:MAG: SPOR domain-containing protein [Kordiimonas sp.]
MTYCNFKNSETVAYIRKAAFVAASSLVLSACMGGGTSNLWQGQEVLVEARQEVLEQDVYAVSDNHRELKDRFDALERLYVELVQQVRARDQKMAELEAHVNQVQQDPQLAASMRKVSNDVSAMRREMKTLENRVFSVELSDPSSVTPINQQAPTGAAETGAAVKPSEAAGTPVAASAPPSQKVFFGVHLASYRSQDQVSTGWSGLEQNFGMDLNGLTPLIYTQSQEGIGTFLRLIAGPLINEQEATDLCGRIRQNANEQYCRVTEYQGEPIG